MWGYTVLVGFLTGLNKIERELTQERTIQSVEYRRKTGGNLGGRPKTSPKKEKLVLRLREEGDSLRSIQEQTVVAVKTIRRIIGDNEKVEVAIKWQNGMIILGRKSFWKWSHIHFQI